MLIMLEEVMRGSFLEVEDMDESEIALPEWDEKDLNFELAA